MYPIVRYLALAILACVALPPLLAEIANALLPVVATLFVCAVVFASVGRRRQR